MTSLPVTRQKNEHQIQTGFFLRKPCLGHLIDQSHTGCSYSNFRPFHTLDPRLAALVISNASPSQRILANMSSDHPVVTVDLLKFQGSSWRYSLIVM